MGNSCLGSEKPGAEEKAAFLGYLLARTFSRAVHGLPSVAGGLFRVLHRKMGRSFPAGLTVELAQHQSPTSVDSLLCLDPLASHDDKGIVPGLREQTILVGPAHRLLWSLKQQICPLDNPWHPSSCSNIADSTGYASIHVPVLQMLCLSDFSVVIQHPLVTSNSTSLGTLQLYIDHS